MIFYLKFAKNEFNSLNIYFLFLPSKFIFYLSVIFLHSFIIHMSIQQIASNDFKKQCEKLIII